MTDLISRSAVLDALREAEFQHWHPLDEIDGVIDAILSLDAVPVVRCNRCKYYEQDTGFCQYFGSGNQWDGFCNKGARMDGEVSS